MDENKTKKLLREGDVALGTFCYLASPWVVEIAGRAGFDFVIIDLEHAGKDIQVVEAMVVAAELCSMTPLVRVPSVDEKQILQVLETGAQGILIPLADSAETVARAIDGAKYPPAGNRGVCRSTRAARFGMEVANFAEFAQTTNDELLVIAMIEDRKGVENVEEILGTGVDGLLLGRADLSGSLGVMGELEHPRVLEAVEQVTTAVVEHPTAWIGNLCYSPDDVERWFEKGHRFLSYGIDTLMLSLGYKAAVTGSRERIAEMGVGVSPG